MTRRLIAVGFLIFVIVMAAPAGAQTPTNEQEINARTTTLAEAQQRLDGILSSQNQPGEVNVRGLVLTDSTFFTGSGPTDFTTLVGKIQGTDTEVKLQGTVNGSRFEAKVEAGEVKLRGLALTQDQFNTLVTQLRGTTGIQEFRVQAVVGDRVMIAKFEDGRLRIRTELRDSGRGPGSDHEGRGRSRVEKTEKVEKVEKSDRPERVDKVERVEKVDRAEKDDRIEKPERSGRH